jgi:hypothetical protein
MSVLDEGGIGKENENKEETEKEEIEDDKEDITFQ